MLGLSRAPVATETLEEAPVAEEPDPREEADARVSTLVITQVKSANGTNGRQRDTLRSLGLRGIGKTVERPDSEPLRGMVHAVRHLVNVEEKS